MARVEFLLPDGQSRVVESGATLKTVMEVGRAESIPGIIGDCGGFMSCATCHVYVEPEWRDAVGPPSQEESEILDMTSNRKPESRLGCQIWLEKELSGLRLCPADSV